MQAKNYKKAILMFLESKNNSADIDEFLIDELIFHMELLGEIKIQLREHGVIEPSSWGRRNSPEFTTYIQLIKEVKNDFQCLGISPAIRAKLKLEAAETIDEFDKVFTR